jgi:carotenoid cleavage dioxygenase-like enzyme
MTTMDEPAIDPYLSGVWEPVHDELVATDLPVTGPLPAGLVGSYLRNGPNPVFAPLGRYHLFDGDGMLHGVRLEDGKASYRNRWIESAALGVERRAGRSLYGGLSEFKMPDPEVMAEGGPMKNTANTHVVRHAGRTFALLEAARPTQVGPDLETLGEYDYDGALVGPMTAHPKIDPVTGEMIFFGYNPFPPYLRVHVADASGRLVRTVEVDLPAPVMMHDVAVSSRYVILFDLPAVFDLPSMLAGGPGIRWEPSNGSRIGVLDRQDLDAPPRWFDMDDFWMFHTLNAYDDGTAVVVEGCRTDRLNAAFGEDEPVRAAPPTLHRWRIDLASGRVTDEQLDDRPGDFPRVNDDRAGLNTRYGYVARATRWNDDDVVFDGFVKHDLHGGTSAVYEYGQGTVAGEPVFAPDPERTGDDDGGWILNYVYDRAEDRSDFVVVDAAAMAEVARVHLPRRVPSGFHGNWFAAE